MINASDITQALACQLQNYSSFFQELKTKDIKVSDYVNCNPDRAPWCGVYRRSVKSVPRTLGVQSSWQLVYKIAVVVQATSVKTGKECEEKLEELVSLALDGIIADRTIDGTVCTLNGWDVEYTYIETERLSTYFQSALINLEVEVDFN